MNEFGQYILQTVQMLLQSMCTALFIMSTFFMCVCFYSIYVLILMPYQYVRIKTFINYPINSFYQLFGYAP